jgi:predicted glycoside hydrolase/deacetylase ChbG (UPF0249 family)
MVSGREMSPEAGTDALLIVTADDYGYRRPYDEGILEAARAGAVDAVSAMVGRRCEPRPLLETGVEIGLHLELPGISAEERGARAGGHERERARRELILQLERFQELFGRPPAHIDGHHHCHAAAGLASVLARVASERGLPVRSVSPSHRRLLRCLGIPTPDRLIGRLDASEPALPALLERAEGLPAGVTEWMVHPGRRDPDSGSSYDAAREEDLNLVLSLRRRLGPLRTTHAAALGRRPG